MRVAALGRADHRRLNGLTDLGSCPQVTTDQCQQPVVAHLSGHADHQDIVPHVVEELRQVQIDGDAVAGLDVTLYLPERSVGGASWSKAEARFRKPRIEKRPNDLCNGLLDHLVHDRGDVQLPFASAGLQDSEPSHRLRLIGAITQGVADRGPVQTCVLGEVLDGHPVAAGRHLVGHHPLPCPLQVRPVHSHTIRSSCKAGCVAPRRNPSPPVGLNDGCESPTAPPWLLMFGPSPPGHSDLGGYYSLC